MQGSQKNSDSYTVLYAIIRPSWPIIPRAMIPRATMQYSITTDAWYIALPLLISTRLDQSGLCYSTPRFVALQFHSSALSALCWACMHRCDRTVAIFFLVSHCQRTEAMLEAPNSLTLCSKFHTTHVLSPLSLSLYLRLIF